MKSIISPGFGKCGTTYIDEKLRVNGRFHTPKRKELNYFLRAKKLDQDRYLSKFRRDPSASGDLDGQTTLECSPPYMTHPDFHKSRTAISRMHELMPDAFLVICLRHPMKRAFSHYRHMIDNFSRFGANRRTQAVKVDGLLFDKPWLGSYADSIPRQPQLTLGMADRLDMVADAFGPDRILLHFLETDGRDFEGFYGRLCDFTGLENDGFGARASLEPRTERNASGSFPSYYYGGEKGAKIAGGRHLEAGQFLATTSRGEDLHDNVSKERADSALQARKTWSRDLSQENTKKLFDLHYREEGEKLMELIARRFPNVTNPPDYAKAPTGGEKRLPDQLPTSELT